MLDHVVERNALGRFRVAEQQPRVAARNESFGHRAEQIKSEHRENETNRDRVQRMAQHGTQAPFIKLKHPVVDAFSESPPTPPRRMATFFMQRALANRRR